MQLCTFTRCHTSIHITAVSSSVGKRSGFDSVSVPTSIADLSFGLGLGLHVGLSRASTATGLGLAVARFPLSSEVGTV